jgi:hypothetical protein
MTRFRAGLLVVTAAVAGCSGSPGAAPSAAASVEEDQVKQTFAAFQKAMRAKDADKVWELLDDESRAEATRVAKAISDGFTKATAEEKDKQAAALGLPAADLSALTGTGFLKTKRFLGKYDEVSESKLEKVVVVGDKATVNYTEPDGDKEKFAAVREGGQWKLTVPIPSAK